MSQKLISRSADLSQLRAEGFNIEIRGGYLLVRDVPYLDENKQVKSGTLVAKLVLAGDVVSAPGTHTIYFGGDYPHNSDGTPIEKFRCNSKRRVLYDGVVVDHQFSAKPQPSGRYDSYYHQISTYCAILGGPAAEIDEKATARSFAPVLTKPEEDIPFHYVDTGSSRSEISMASDRLAIGKVAIIGLGGTGSYVLDLVAKTPVREIHLFDKDHFLSHNAFRGPGAPTIEELRTQPLKVEHFAGVYSRMHRGVVAHPVHLDVESKDLLRGMDFAFVCVDDGLARRSIVQVLESQGISFVDTGMGLYMGDDGLGGVVRVTTSTPDQRSHFRSLVPMAEDAEGDDYSQSIQVADLNALNAAMAVIRWKKSLGFYMDYQSEHQSTYGVEVQLMTRVGQDS